MKTDQSPLGVFRYPNLTKPRDFKGDKNFSFDCSLVLEGQDAADFASKVDAWMVESQKELKKPKGNAPYQPLLTKDGEEVPGKLVFKFRVPHKWPNGDTRKPKLFDSHGKPVQGEISIGGGSIGRLKFLIYNRVFSGTAGITLQPIAVQITKFVEGGDLEEVSFDEVEGGDFSAESVRAAADAGFDDAGGDASAPADGSGF
jgi:hypothetical protein